MDYPYLSHLSSTERNMNLPVLLGSRIAFTIDKQQRIQKYVFHNRPEFSVFICVVEIKSNLIMNQSNMQIKGNRERMDGTFCLALFMYVPNGHMQWHRTRQGGSARVQTGNHTEPMHNLVWSERWGNLKQIFRTLWFYQIYTSSQKSYLKRL